MIRIYKNKAFARFMRKEGMDDGKLREAVRLANNGLVEADLGGGLIKLRIAREGSGKSGGYRTMVIYRSGERAFFVHGFAKNRKANLTKHEERYYKEAAVYLLRLTAGQIAALVKQGNLIEVEHDEAIPQ